jgi:hypothetical protein
MKRSAERARIHVARGTHKSNEDISILSIPYFAPEERHAYSFGFLEDERSGGAQCEQHKDISLLTEQASLEMVEAINMLLLGAKHCVNYVITPNKDDIQ